MLNVPNYKKSNRYAKMNILHSCAILSLLSLKGMCNNCFTVHCDVLNVFVLITSRLVNNNVYKTCYNCHLSTLCILENTRFGKETKYASFTTCRGHYAAIIDESINLPLEVKYGFHLIVYWSVIFLYYDS